MERQAIVPQTVWSAANFDGRPVVEIVPQTVQSAANFDGCPSGEILAQAGQPTPRRRQTSMNARVAKFWRRLDSLRHDGGKLRWMPEWRNFGAGWTAYATMEANFDGCSSGEILAQAGQPTPRWRQTSMGARVAKFCAGWTAYATIKGLGRDASKRLISYR